MFRVGVDALLQFYSLSVLQKQQNGATPGELIMVDTSGRGEGGCPHPPFLLLTLQEEEMEKPVCLCARYTPLLSVLPQF